MNDKKPTPDDLLFLSILAIENEDENEAFQRCANDDQAWQEFYNRGRFLGLQLLLSLHAKFEELTPEASANERLLHRGLLMFLGENLKNLNKYIEAIPDKTLQMQIAAIADEMFEQCARLGKFSASLPLVRNSQNIKRTKPARKARGAVKQKRQEIIKRNYKGDLRADSKCVRGVLRQLGKIFTDAGLKLPSEKTIERDISDILSERP
ncbi:MAG: hypothetical protein EKK29_17305 [Hyphomicrobiales bacterium]|nr:MAG: hypothetical protein EKK29_17305 [Hyphomicrobiales bacterium]